MGPGLWEFMVPSPWSTVYAPLKGKDAEGTLKGGSGNSGREGLGMTLTHQPGVAWRKGCECEQATVGDRKAPLVGSRTVSAPSPPSSPPHPTPSSATVCSTSPSLTSFLPTTPHFSFSPHLVNKWTTFAVTISLPPAHSSTSMICLLLANASFPSPVITSLTN